MLPSLDPVALYRLSAALRRRGARRSARLIKAINFIVFRAIIPPELEAGKNFRLGHFGFGVVIHPNTTIGRNVFLGHGVTLGTDLDLGDPRRMTIGDDVNVGVGAIVLGPVAIGRGAVIGAGAVVTRDVPADTVVVGVPARPVEKDSGG